MIFELSDCCIIYVSHHRVNHRQNVMNRKTNVMSRKKMMMNVMNLSRNSLNGRHWCYLGGCNHLKNRCL